MLPLISAMGDLQWEPRGLGWYGEPAAYVGVQCDGTLASFI